MASKAKPVETIGSTELVAFPDLQIEKVPAKVDTGADSSAIWASSIHEAGGKLSFVLFDVNSPYYTGQKVTTHDYRIVSIKNSFGHSELRYKVRMNVVIAGKVIRVRFTLANRSNNRFPILLGRRTLKNKFVVDVSKNNTKQELYTLLLTTARTQEVKEFVRGIESVNKHLHVTLALYDDLEFRFGTQTNNIILRDSGRDLASFDFVHFKTTAKHLDVAAATARYLQKRGVPFVDTAVATFPASSKLDQYTILSDNGITVPNSIFVHPSALKESYDHIKTELELPFVLKDINGRKGDNNFLINNKKEFDAACNQAANDRVQLIAQQFIPNVGDYRILVLGKKISLVILRARSAHSSSHLNNTSQGAKASLVDLNDIPAKVQSDSIVAAKLLQREVAGVDMVQDKKTKSWYCLEVNDGPQLATGVFLQEKRVVFAKFIQDELTRQGK